MVYMGSSFVDGKGTVSLNRRYLYILQSTKIMQVRRLTNTIKEGRTMMVTTMLMMGMHLAYAEQVQVPAEGHDESVWSPDGLKGCI